MKVVVAMSGGVDSSVAAALLKERGHEVIGVSMQLWDYSEAPEAGSATGGSCCSLEDLTDARRVCDLLEIPFYVLNMEKPFTREVVDYFVDSYLAGRTPNPCTRCNEALKFRALLIRTRELEADALATGHYARIVEPTNEGEPWRLFRGVDPDKDQSYFLFTMNQRELPRVLFPLGEMTKGEVREEARRLGLRTAEKAESQEICFIPDDDYASFIAERAGLDKALRPGDIVDRDGDKLGSHGGLFRYTIGQRKGLGIGGSGGPYYVTALDMETNKLVVGAEEELYSKGLEASGFNWTAGAPGPGERLTASIRYRHAGVGCGVSLTSDSTVTVNFKTPEKSVTPGQAVVIYRGDEVVGGGWIERAL